MFTENNMPQNLLNGLLTPLSNGQAERKIKIYNHTARVEE